LRRVHWWFLIFVRMVSCSFKFSTLHDLMARFLCQKYFVYPSMRLTSKCLLQRKENLVGHWFKFELVRCM